MTLIPGSASIINGRFTLRLDALPKMTNGSHGHWRAAAAERKKWKESACLYARMAWRKAPLLSCKITATRYSSVEPDKDNRGSGYKGVLDGLKAAGVILDDGPTVMKEFIPLWGEAPRGKGYITVEVEEIK